MESFIIHGGNQLRGKVEVSGSKNASLPILAACLLLEDKICLENVPHLQDVTTMLALLNNLGMKIEFDNSYVIMDSSNINIDSLTANLDLVQAMRASILVLGPLVSRHGSARIINPGGCSIGSRPIDVHIEGLKAMGVEISYEKEFLVTHKVKRLQAIDFTMPVVSVTGTENLVMAATLAKGQTILRNCAIEPEVVNLCDFLNAAGADVKIDGKNIIINGKEKLVPISENFSIISDRIELATYLCALTVVGGELVFAEKDCINSTSVINLLKSIGLKFINSSGNIIVESTGKINNFDLETNPYPEFPTDAQPQFSAVATLACGISTIKENIFEARYKHLLELEKMGAKIKISDNLFIIEGVTKLTGAEVQVTDLRAGACLIIAGLAAKGKTIINDIVHIDRGYKKIEQQLTKLGANIERVIK